MWYESIVEIKVKLRVDAMPWSRVPAAFWTAIRRTFKVDTVAAHRSLYFLAALSPQQPWRHGCQ